MTRLKVFCCGILAFAAIVSAACSKDPETAKKEHFEQGNAYFAKKEYSQAVIEYSNALRYDERFADARLALAESYDALGNTRAAYPHYIRAADLLKDNPTVQIRAGTMLFNGGNFREASDRARGVLQNDPNNVSALLLLANALAGMQNVDGAVSAVERALRIEPNRTSLHTMLGIFHMAQGKKVEAEADFLKAVEVSGGSAEAHLGLGNYYKAMGRRQDAERSLKLALSLRPDDVRANQDMAAFYRETGRAAEAEPHLKRIARDVPSRMALADYYLAEGRRADAFNVLQALAAEKESFALAKNRMAQAEYSAGNITQALKTTDEVLAREPRNLEALTFKARLFLTQNKLDEAFETAKKAIDIDPKSAPAQLTLGRILLARGQVEPARRAFGETLSVDPSSLPAQLELARLHLSRGEIDTSIQFAERAVTNHPNDAQANVTLARSLMARADDRQGAARQLEKLLARFPNLPAAHTLKGSFYLAGGDRANARRSFERALELDPSFLEGLTGLIALDVTEKKGPQARKRVEASLAQAPDNPQLLLLAAKTYTLDRDLAKVESTLKKLLQVDPSNPEAYGMLGELYATQGRVSEARTEFEQMARVDPRSVAAHTMLGLVYYIQNNIPEAQKSWERALEVDPGAAAAANNLAWTYAEGHGSLDTALQLAQVAASRFPDQPEVMDTLGWIYYKKNMFAQALTYLQESSAKDPTNPLYSYHVGMVLAKQGDDAKARVALERALKLQPNFDGAQEAKRALSSLVY